MFQRAGRRLGDHIRDAGGAALGNDDGSGAGGVGGADDGAEIVRIFHAVEHDEHLARCDGFEVGVLARGAEGDDALVRGGTGQAVQRGARFEAHRHAGAAREIDDFLQARASGALRDHDALDGVAGSAGLRRRDECR